MKHEVHNNTCTAINHMGDTTKDSLDLVQWAPVGALNPNSQTNVCKINWT